MHINKNALPHSDLDPGMLHESERFDVWRESISPLFDSLPKRTRDDHVFDVKARLFLGNECIFSNTSFNEQRFLRNSRWCELHDPDHILVQLYTEGGYVGRNGHRNLEIRAGDIALLDLGYTLSTTADTSNAISLILPRRTIVEYCGAQGLEYGYVIPKETALAQFMAGQMRLMWEQLHSLDAAMAEVALDKLSQSFMDFFRIAQQGKRVPENTSSSVVLDTCKVFIESNLGDKRLSVSVMCRQLGLSRSTVYRIFQDEGGIASYILRRRLFRCYRELAYGHSDKIIETAMRWGFSDHSHFTKCFKKEFGVTPSEVYEQSADHSVSQKLAAVAVQDIPEYQQWLIQL